MKKKKQTMWAVEVSGCESYEAIFDSKFKAVQYCLNFPERRYIAALTIRQLPFNPVSKRADNLHGIIDAIRVVHRNKKLEIIYLKPKGKRCNYHMLGQCEQKREPCNNSPAGTKRYSERLFSSKYKQVVKYYRGPENKKWHFEYFGENYKPYIEDG